MKLLSFCEEELDNKEEKLCMLSVVDKGYKKYVEQVRQ